MKKTLLILYLVVFSVGLNYAQCVYTCSNYIVSPINFSLFPTAGNNAVPLFSPNTDDGYTSPVPLGFNFNYYCNNYSNVLIYTNGLLQFNIGSPSTFPLGYDAAQMIPNPSVPTILNGIVAFKMDDLDPTVGGTVTYTTIGTSPNQMFVLTYSDVPIYGNPALLNSGQIVLYETTNIIEIYTIYAPVSPNLATQGVEDPTGTIATASPGRNQTFWSGNSDGYRFSPYSPAPPSAITGPTTVCQGSQNSFQTTSALGATSYTWSYPPGWTGPYNTTAVTTTAGATGNLSVTATYSSCGTSAPTVLNVSVTPSPVVSIVSTNPQILCSGNTFTLVPGGASNYTLEPGTATVTGSGSFVITSNVTTTYTLTGSDANNCPSYNLVTSAVLVNPTPTVTAMSGTICLGQTFSMSPGGALNYNITGGFANVSPGSAGTYTYAITGMAGNGCSNLVPVISSLTVSPNPTLNIVASKPSFCKGETSILTASVANTYSWNTGDTGPTLALSSTLVPGTYNYTVTGTTTEGCSKSKSINVTVNACAGLEETTAGNVGLMVYPNPSGGLLHLQFESISENTGIKLYDATGRLVLNRGVAIPELQIDLTGLASGLYYMKVTNGHAVETLKVIKE